MHFIIAQIINLIEILAFIVFTIYPEFDIYERASKIAQFGAIRDV